MSVNYKNLENVLLNVRIFYLGKSKTESFMKFENANLIKILLP